MEGYGRFLTAQAAAHLPVEAALDDAGAGALLADWPSRKRAALIEADLDEIGLGRLSPEPPPPLADVGAVMGALYVLEGSRLGGAVLKNAIPVGAPRRFLDAPQAPGAWRKLLVKIEEILYEPRRVEAASATAREVFLRFEAAGRAVWSPPIVE